MRRALVAVALTLTACSSAPALWSGPLDVLDVEAPRRLGDLRVTVEEVDELLLTREKPYYLDAVGLLGLRAGKELRATLQVGRFGPNGDAGDAALRRRIVATIGAAQPRALLVGERLLHATVANQQQVFAWFGRDRFYVLTVRADHPMPRTLVREVLEAFAR